jgi:uncharacterized protein (DUF111 family)
LSRQHDLEKLEQILFEETTTIGLRKYPVEKRMLKRSFDELETPYGVVTIKRAYLNGVCVNAKPEYEQCKTIANEKGISLQRLLKEIEMLIK